MFAKNQELLEDLHFVYRDKVRKIIPNNKGIQYFTDIKLAVVEHDGPLIDGIIFIPAFKLWLVPLINDDPVPDNLLLVGNRIQMRFIAEIDQTHVKELLNNEIKAEWIRMLRALEYNMVNAWMDNIKRQTPVI